MSEEKIKIYRTTAENFYITDSKNKVLQTNVEIFNPCKIRAVVYTRTLCDKISEFKNSKPNTLLDDAVKLAYDFFNEQLKPGDQIALDHIDPKYELRNKVEPGTLTTIDTIPLSSWEQVKIQQQREKLESDFLLKSIEKEYQSQIESTLQEVDYYKNQYDQARRKYLKILEEKQHKINATQPPPVMKLLQEEIRKSHISQ